MTTPDQPGGNTAQQPTSQPASNPTPTQGQQPAPQIVERGDGVSVVWSDLNPRH